MQQATLVRQMVRDLDWPLEIVVVPTVREPDGLALSSRNVYLDADERPRKRWCLSAALRAAHEALARRASAGRGGRCCGIVRRVLAMRSDGWRWSISPSPSRRLSRRWRRSDADTVVALAGRVGRTRLIDNIILGQGLD